jgi:hypothetical protein
MQQPFDSTRRVKARCCEADALGTERVSRWSVAPGLEPTICRAGSPRAPKSLRSASLALVVAMVASSVLSTAVAQAPPGKDATATQSAPSGTPARSRYQPDRFAGRAGTYYRLIWGIEAIGVKWTESGEVIRFSYRVLDPEKAKTLNEKQFEPSLIDPQAGVSLVVPTMDKIGKLRQSSTPEAGKSYWMAFSNKGRLVKRGHRVSVVIGKFRADGLVVD